MNSYNIYDKNNYSTVLYHAVASSEDEIKRLADQKGYNIEGLKIELIKRNVRNELGRPMKGYICNALVQ